MFTLYSRAIMCYLVEQYAKDDSLYPKDPKKRSLVNQKLYFDSSTLNQRSLDYYVSKMEILLKINDSTYAIHDPNLTFFVTSTFEVISFLAIRFNQIEFQSKKTFEMCSS